MKYLLTGIALTAMLASGVAYARRLGPLSSRLSYSHVRAAYAKMQSDFFDAKATGRYFSLGWQFNRNGYIAVSESRLFFNDMPGELRTYGLALGYQENPMGNTSGFLQVKFMRTKALMPFSPVSGQSDGWVRLSWGFRTIARSSPWELDGGIYYDMKEEFGNRKFGVWLGVAVTWEYFGVRLVGNHNGDQDTVRLGLSVYF